MPVIRDLFLKKVLFPRLEHIKKVGDELAQRPDQIQPLENTPERFNHPERVIKSVLAGERNLKDMITFGNAPLFLLSMFGVLRANKTIEDNPVHPRTEITEDKIEELKELAKSLDYLIGFAKLDHLYIFKDKSISFDNSIVLAMERKLKHSYQRLRTRQIMKRREFTKCLEKPLTKLQTG